MLRTYKIFAGEKLIKTMSTMQDATYSVYNILGKKKFQQCIYEQIYDGNSPMGMRFIFEGKCLMTIRKEINYDSNTL